MTGKHGERFPCRSCPTRMSVDVISANVHPSQSIGRPDPAPATVVAGVEERRADEEEAVMEAVVVETEPWRECGMCEMSAAKMRTADTHRGDMWAAHAMHPAAHGMHSTAHGMS